MSMPDNGAPWPPAPFDTVAAHIDQLQAWWEGDIDRLDSYDQSRSGPVSTPWQYNGGVGGVAARAIFGAPPPAGMRTRRVHVPLSADIARSHAMLMAGQPPSLRIAESGGNDAAKRRLDLIANPGVSWGSANFRAKIDRSAS